MSSQVFKVKLISPRALYTHCFSHCLNLSIAASCGDSEVSNLIMVINEAYLFLSNGPKRQSVFELAVSPDNYPQLESSEGSWNWDRETKIRAEGLKASLSLFNTF